ncbi:MAG: hypothetical protein GY714_30875 [Desulfobacterales bacterium]|nr:hypothetical protein [Desulfobacterales bacterium]MCP4163598.1 hypothetical protein [Deltaproteobacteria bacterium]
MKNITILSLLMFLLLHSTTFADTLKKGIILETKQTLNIRQTPPEQKWLFVKNPGKAIGSIAPGKKVIIKSLKTIKSAFGKDVWVEITEQNTDQPKSGWVYYGSEKETENFK